MKKLVSIPAEMIDGEIKLWRAVQMAVPDFDTAYIGINCVLYDMINPQVMDCLVDEIDETLFRKVP